MAKPRFCVCKSGGDPVYPVVEVRRVHDESDGDRTELHIRSPVAICQTCGGGILSRETRALLRVERKLGQLERRLDGIENPTNGAIPQGDASANGATPEGAKLLTAQELGRRWRVRDPSKPRLIYRLVDEGKITPIPTSKRRFLFPIEDIEEFERTHGTPETGGTK